MKTFQLTWGGALLALLAASCADPAQSLLSSRAALLDGGTPPCPVDASTCVPVSPPETLDGGFSDGRWIVRVQAPPCPPVESAARGTWRSGQLFGAESQIPLPPVLSGYCVYEWQADDPLEPAPPDLEALQDALKDVALEAVRDLGVVGSLGTSAGVDAGWRTMRSELFAQTGRVGFLPISDGSPPAEVRIAVVDSAPTGYSGGLPASDRSGHGEAVGWLIREHTCITDAGVPPGSQRSACVGQIANHLALPRITPTIRDMADGGYFGFQGEMARAIHGAVQGWRAHGQDGGAQRRLVINLSLGWDPHYGGDYGSPSELALPARAVWLAIQHASCHGALVVAAAGNDPGGPEDVGGPMYPAGWETKPAPDEAACIAAEGPGYSPDGGEYPLFPPTSGAAYRPMVYAVGGVRGDDLPLESTRRGGRPRLAAPASHAVAENAGSPTPVISGSSAAAAVTSAVAATVWGYRPTLSGPEVMQLVRQGGTGLQDPADFCLGGLECPMGSTDPRREVVRVNQCEALQAACAGGLDRCPSSQLSLPACTPRPARQGSPTRLSAAELATIEASARTVKGVSLRWELSPLGLCGHVALLAGSPDYPVHACASRQYYGAPIRPWSAPQPSSDPCPSCSLYFESVTSKWSLLLSIDSDVTTVWPSELRVNDTYAGANDGYGVDLSWLGPLSGGEEVKVEDLDLSGAGPEVRSAYVSFRLGEANDPLSSASMLMVNP